MSKVAGHLVVVVLFVSLTASPVLAQCGVERWSVKTGTDPDAGLVNLSSTSSTTIATMRSWTAPNPIPMAAPDPNKPDRGPERLIHTG